ncbi:MAG TPA: conjugal transfer protein TraF [Myxococcota bacterium]|nr:conjugal transfer protein TraF [Myxococcota bacterium]
MRRCLRGRPDRVLRLALAASFLVLPGMGLFTPAASAEEWSFVGARYQGMGGAGVAMVDDEHASYWNPGALAFTRSYGVALPVGAQVAAQGDVLSQVDRVTEFIDGLGGATYDQLVADLQAGNPLDATQLGTALDLAAVQLPALDQPGSGLVGSANASLLLRYQHVAVSGIGLAHFGADPVFDRQNLSVSSLTAGAAIDSLINPGTAMIRYVGPDRPDVVADVTALFIAAGATAPNEQAEEYVFAADQAGVNVRSAGVARNLVDIARATIDGTGSLADNASGTFVRGLSVQEVGVAYGHPLPIPIIGGKIGIGAQIKYLYGTTFNKFVRFDEIGSASDLVDEIRDADRRETSHTASLDLGVLVKPFEWLRVGLTARNVTSPEFDLARDPARPGSRSKLTLDPQVRFGAAVWILPNWAVAFDADLTENESQLVDGFSSRIVSLGTELRIPIWKLALALRGGAYLNTEADEPDEVALTGGIGLRVFDFAFDLAAGASPKTERVAAANDQQIPSRMNVSAMLSFRREF